MLSVPLNHNDALCKEEVRFCGIEKSLQEEIISFPQLCTPLGKIISVTIFEQNEILKIKFFCHIIAVIDECGDFLMGGGNEAVTLLTKLIQLCRAAGIYIFLSTQKPVSKIFPTTVKSNAPGRFAFKVTSQTDSFVILDEGGAESLLGNGDMIFQFNSLSSRYQAAYIDDSEIQRITQYVSRQCPQDFFFKPDEIEKRGENKPGSVTDDLFYDIARFVVGEQKCSNNQISKRFGIGFNRCSEIISTLEYYNIVGKNEGTKAREILLTKEEVEIVLDRIKHGRQ